MKKGFTLTELLAVIAIIAILSIAAVSGYSAMTRNSKKKVLEQKIQSIEIAAEKYAKENNVSNSVTISVNKLVVMGYLQPDSSADDGYAVILNPVNNENMICNLISIKIVKEEVITEYNENAKDCTIADKDYLDSNIIITAYNFTNETNRLISYEEDNILKWTKEDVLLLVTTNYDIKNIYSFTYEYGGNTIEKHTNLKTATNPHGLDDIDKISEYYNELLISDVGSLFNRDVTVILNMKDGTTNAKRVIVRIDKEPPTGYIVESSDISTN